MGSIWICHIVPHISHDFHHQGTAGEPVEGLGWICHIRCSSAASQTIEPGRACRKQGVSDESEWNLVDLSKNSESCPSLNKTAWKLIIMLLFLQPIFMYRTAVAITGPTYQSPPHLWCWKTSKSSVSGMSKKFWATKSTSSKADQIGGVHLWSGSQNLIN